MFGAFYTPRALLILRLLHISSLDLALSPSAAKLSTDAELTSFDIFATDLLVRPLKNE